MFLSYAFSQFFIIKQQQRKEKNHKPQQTRSTSQSESNGKEARLICVDCIALEPLRLPDSFLAWHLYLGSAVGRPPFGEHFLCFRFCPCMALLPAPTFVEKKKSSSRSESHPEKWQLIYIDFMFSAERKDTKELPWFDFSDTCLCSSIFRGW